MLAFLNVFYQNNGAKVNLGTLQVGKNAPSANSDGRYFEWRGQNGSNDGGTWKWVNDAYYGNMFTMELRSNTTQTVVVVIHNADWGMTEPNEPLFKAGAGDSLIYISPVGKSFTALWETI